MEMKGENMEYRLLGETGFKVPVLSPRHCHVWRQQ